MFNLPLLLEAITFEELVDDPAAASAVLISITMSSTLALPFESVSVVNVTFTFAPSSIFIIILTLAACAEITTSEPSNAAVLSALILLLPLCLLGVNHA